MINTIKQLPTVSKELFLRPFQEFARIEASGGILLLVCTALALLWANSPWSAAYTNLWHSKLSIGAGDYVLSKDLLHWINDGLMVVFFFLVGLEIKREVLIGELSSAQKAALPIAAALGGMLFPAGIYFALNAGRAGAAGWGIPMATDIAFALGVLALLGNRVPLALKVFLTALAIADDIGAVLVIALFYTEQIAFFNLLVGGGILLLLFALNLAGVHRPLVYAVLGIGLWLAFLTSGVHATVAGVLLALTIPSGARTSTAEFLARSRSLLKEFEKVGASDQESVMNEDQQSIVHALEQASEEVQTPLQRMERALHGWVTYMIMPIFALANAGVSVSGNLSEALTSTVSLGVISGLVVGKPMGITLFTWLAVKSGLAVMPSGVQWREVYGVSWLGGIGFTMSLFIASLAFGEAMLLMAAKVGILSASLISGVVGWALLRR